MDEETVAQREKVTCPRLYSQEVREPRSKPRQSDRTAWIQHHHGMRNRQIQDSLLREHSAALCHFLGGER